MKDIVRYSVLLFAVLMMGCSDDDGVTPMDDDPPMTIEEEQAEITTEISESPWSSSSVSVEGSDESSEFDGFSLSFGDGQYDTTNGGRAWPESGTWEFVDGSTDQILRDDDVLIDLELGENTLTLRFEIEEEVLLTGRLKRVNTEFVFVLNR